MSWTAIIVLSLFTLLVIGITVEMRMKKGKHRPLTKTQPDARSVSLKTMPDQRTGEQHDVVIPGLRKRKDELKAQDRQHRNAIRKRKATDIMAEKRNRIRPWDRH